MKGQISRSDIHLISRNSNWPNEEVQKALSRNVYHGRRDWVSFIQIVSLSLGVGFLSIGVLFFFAYNWSDLHKFTKLSLVAGIITAMTIASILTKKELISNVLLMGAALLVGVLIGVFGQIYQTGADAYDLFLGWTLFITVWVAFSRFAPLWLLYIVLINATAVLYGQQVAHNWSELFIIYLLIILNGLFLISCLLIKSREKSVVMPHWFIRTLALGLVCCSTLGLIMGIFEPHDPIFIPLLITLIIIYIAGLYYGLKSRQTFYLAIIAFSLIVSFAAFLLKLSDGMGTFLFVSIFILIAVTLVIKWMMDLTKKWGHE